MDLSHRCGTIKKQQCVAKNIIRKCNICDRYFCPECLDVHDMGGCYLCGKAGCYVRSIGRVVCYICL